MISNLPKSSCGDLASAKPRGESPRLRNPLCSIGIFAGLWCVITFMQWCSGAFEGAFAAEADEPSHYVTGLMIRDYIAAGFPANPIAFAETFYLHYPRVAFGLWPPLFHIVYGCWMFLFGEHRSAVLALLAAITASWSFLFFHILQPKFGLGLSLLATVLLLSLPPIQSASATVMLDTAVVLPLLAAVIFYARFLEQESIRYAALFGVCAGIAAMVKYNGLMLALLPPVAVLLTGRYNLLTKPSFWLPAPIVAAIAGPWYFAMRRWVFYAAEYGDGEISVVSVAGTNLRELVFVGGPLLFALAILGTGIAVFYARRRRDAVHGEGWDRHAPICALAILVSCWIFHSFLYPIQGLRYHLISVAAILLLNLLELDSVMRVLNKIFPHSVRGIQIAAIAILVAPYALVSFYVPMKRTRDFVSVTDRILAEPLRENSVVLVASDAMGEGALISEMAMRGPRAHHFVLRSSKFVVRQKLMGQESVRLFETAKDLMSALDSIPVSLVVLDDSRLDGAGQRSEQLADLAHEYPDRWQLVDSVQKQSGGRIRIFRLKGNPEKSFNGFSIDMRYSLSRSIRSGVGDGRSPLTTNSLKGEQ